MTFVPRVIDDQGIKWNEIDDNKIMTSEEVAERIIYRFVKNIEEITDD